MSSWFQLSRVKVFLTDNMHTSSTWENPLFCMREECSRVVRFELVHMFGKIPSPALGTSLLSFSLFVGPNLEFKNAATLLMSRFDLYFSKRWSFLVPDTRVTWRGRSESNSLNCFGKFALGWLKISTRLSKNGPMVTFVLDASLPRHTSTS